MAQWVNRLRNNIFVNAPPLPLLCEISGALHLAQPGLMAGRLAGWQAGWLAGRRNTGEFRIFKVDCRSKYLTCASFKGTASLQPYQCIPAGFSGKAYCKVDF